MIVNSLNFNNRKKKSVHYMAAWRLAVTEAIASGCQLRADIVAACDKLVAEKKLIASTTSTANEVHCTIARMRSVGRLTRIANRLVLTSKENCAQ